MAHYRKRSGSWYVEVEKRGIRTSATFPTKVQATAWATEREAEILAGAKGVVPNKTVADLFERYRDDVSSIKRGKRWETIRLDAWAKLDLGKVRLSDLDQPHIVQWRDDRLKKVSGATVRREMNLLSHVFAITVKEWKWLRENPVKGVRRPQAAPPRERRVEGDELDRLMVAGGYTADSNLPLATQRVAAAALFAVETGMRAGEIVALTVGNVDLERRVARVIMSKNGTARDVPLSPRAAALALQLRQSDANDALRSGQSDANLALEPRERDANGALFRLTNDQIDALWRRMRDLAGIDGLHFHDLRAEATTRLSKKLDILTLARMLGHKDVRMLQVYYRESAEETARRL